VIDPTISNQLNGSLFLQEYNGLNLIPKWNQPATAGDSGGPSGLPHGTYTWTPGDPSMLAIQPKQRAAGKPWDTYYWYNNLLLGKTPATYFGYAMQVCFPTAKDIAACTAWENELEICEAGLRYNMGWQCLVSKADGGPAWRLFDMQNSRWVKVAQIPAPIPKPGQYVNFFSEFSINRATKTVTHEALTIDGTRFPIEAVHSGVQKWSLQTFYFHNAFQLDSDGKGTPYSVNIKGTAARSL
jgi:hypothetical protein